MEGQAQAAAIFAVVRRIDYSGYRGEMVFRVDWLASNKK